LFTAMPRCGSSGHSNSDSFFLDKSPNYPHFHSYNSCHS
jgi:hypothetical protein